MSVTPPKPLIRTNYLSSTTGAGDPNSPSYDPSSVIPAAGFPNYGDVALDTEQYHRPLQRLHGMGLHGAGIAFGMQIQCPTGHPNIVILPGLALDAAGRHIYLAAGGSAEIGPNANVPNTPPNLAPVSAAGVTLPTAGFTGDLYVVAQWRETFDVSSYASDPNVSQYIDTPWLQLVPHAGYLPDVHVILGKVHLDAGANVTAASYGDSGGLQRTSVSLPGQSLLLNRAITTAAPGADTKTWAAVRAREAGGIEVAVANTGDEVHVISDAGGNFSNFAVGANQATVGSLANPGVTLDGSQASVKVGTSGNWGDVQVYNAHNHLAITLTGHTGQVIVGGSTLAGEVRMKNANAQDTMTLNGDTGSAVVQRLKPFVNNTIDVDAGYLAIHGFDIRLDGRSGTQRVFRALVDGNNLLIVNYAGDYRNGVEIQSNLKVDGVLTDGGGVPLMGNPARKVLMTGGMRAGTVGGDPTRITQDITLPRRTQFTAICLLSLIYPTTTFDFDNAVSLEVFEVDGVRTAPWTYGGGKFGSSQGDPDNAYQTAISGVGQTITFRLAAIGPDLQATAFGIVFYE